jgi:hypothetical protein
MIWKTYAPGSWLLLNSVKPLLFCTQTILDAETTMGRAECTVKFAAAAAAAVAVAVVVVVVVVVVAFAAVSLPQARLRKEAS